jgi:Icc-related predicted phosphoesterase
VATSQRIDLDFAVAFLYTPRMRLVLLSDTHGRHKKLSIPDGDVLVHCGDFSHRGNPAETEAFGRWFAAQPHPFKVLVPGNHDAAMEHPVARNLLRSLGVVVVVDQAVVVGGLRFYGSPWTPRFGDWAWMRDDADLAQYFDKIPDDLDVLVTHGPPYGTLDRNDAGTLCGSQQLLHAVTRARPRLHVFGHIHEARGMCQRGNTDFLNVSNLAFDYTRLHEPVVYDIA